MLDLNVHRFQNKWRKINFEAKLKVKLFNWFTLL